MATARTLLNFEVIGQRSFFGLFILARSENHQLEQAVNQNTLFLYCPVLVPSWITVCECMSRFLTDILTQPGHPALGFFYNHTCYTYFTLLRRFGLVELKDNSDCVVCIVQQQFQVTEQRKTWWTDVEDTIKVLSYLRRMHRIGINGTKLRGSHLTGKWLLERLWAVLTGFAVWRVTCFCCHVTLI